MSADQSATDREPNCVTPHASKDPSSDPNSYSLSSIEVWLQQTTPDKPSLNNRKRKRQISDLPSPPHSHQSRFQIPREASVKGEMDLSQSGSPGPSTSSAGGISSSPSKGTPKTPSYITLDDRKIKIPKDASWVKQRLRTYMCYQNEPGALDKYPAFRKKILDILDGNRLSEMSAGSAKKFTQKLSQYADDNEDTFLYHILPTIIKESRTVRSKVPEKALNSPEIIEALGQLQARSEGLQEDEWEKLPDADTQDSELQEHDQEVEKEKCTGEPQELQMSTEESQLIVEDFADSGLTLKVNREFRKDFLPHQPRKPDTILIDAMAKANGMKHAKPDRVFGIHIHHYPVPNDVNISVLTQILLEVVPLLHWPFLIIEGKSMSGSITEATNQACRGGASIINASRLLLDQIGEPAIAGSAPDTATFIFSATISPVIMEIWVHWAEHQEKQNIIFHMHKLRTHAIGDDNKAGKLRKMIHNILDWGCGKRFEETKKIYDKVFDYERKRMAAEDISESNDSTRSPNKRQRRSGK